VPEGSRPDERADLTVVGMTLSPSLPTPGEEVEVQVRVHSAARTGSRGVAERIDVALLTPDGLTQRQELDIAPDTTATVLFLWTAPATGLYGLTAVADPDEKLVERGRADNAVTEEVVVTPQPPTGVDFAVAGIRVVTLPDRPVVPRVTVVNHGGEAASAPLLVEVGGEVIARRVIGPLAPGEGTTIEVDWPPDQSPGVIAAEVNPRFGALEPDPANNRFTLDFRRPVDLAVERVSVHALQAEAGRPPRATISFRVVNVGQNPVTVPFTTRIEGSAIDPLFSLDVVTPALDAGATVYISRTVDFGSFDFGITADAGAVLSETNRTNNVATSSFNLESPGTGQWISIGPRILTSGLGATGRLMTLAVDPKDPSTMYVGSPTGSGGMQGGSGIWKTTDGTATWQPIADGLPTLSIRALAVDPTLPSRVYAATTDAGVFRSEDGGVSWQQVSNQPLNAFGNAGGGLRIDPSNTSRLFLTSTSGIYRSENHGANWTLVLDRGSATGLIMDPSNPAHLYAAIRNDTNLAQTGIYETTNSGANWSATPLTGCPGDDLPNAVTVPTTIRLAMSGSRLYAAYNQGAGNCYTVYRTTGLGCSVGGDLQREWEQGWSTCDEAVRSTLWSGLYADPGDSSVLYATGTYFYVSRNSGSSFQIESGPQPHADHHAFATDPQDSQIIYTACDGGLYRSSDRGKANTWQFLGEGLANVEFYDIADARTQPELVIGGTQDNGTIKYTGASTLWSHIRGGDGATVDIDPSDAGVMYSMGQYANSIRRSADGGASFPTDLGLPVTGNPCFNLHYQVHPGTPSTLLASCQAQATGSLWRRTSLGGNWSVIYTPPSGTVVRTTVDPSANLYYAGANDGRLYGAVGGSGFQRVFAHPFNAGVRDVEVDPDDPTTLFAAFGGGGAGRVYRLRRTGVPPTEATTIANDITTDLPAGVPVRALGIDRWNDDTVYAATTQGVYRGRSVDGGATWSWSLFNNGLPAAVDLIDLQVHPTTGVVRAATLGRSAYEVNTAPPIGSILAIEGRLTLLRVHDVGTGFGPPGDQLDAEVIVRVDSDPDKAFGFQLRADAGEEDHRRMLDLLRDALNHGHRVRIEYRVAGIHNNDLIRVMTLF
jgi:hypothetical protein